MKRLMSGFLALAILASPAMVSAQGKQDSSKSGNPTEMRSDVDILKVDVVYVATGYRASEIIGDPIYNDANEQVGTVDDLIVRSDDKVVYAIVSVGGFLGIGDRLIAVPYQAFGIEGDGKFVLPDATKEQLKNVPEFKYKK